MLVLVFRWFNYEICCWYWELYDSMPLPGLMCAHCGTSFHLCLNRSKPSSLTFAADVVKIENGKLWTWNVARRIREQIRNHVQRSPRCNKRLDNMITSGDHQPACYGCDVANSFQLSIWRNKKSKAKKAANGAWVANMSCALRKAAEFLWIRFFALQLIQGWSRRENGS